MGKGGGGNAKMRVAEYRMSMHYGIGAGPIDSIHKITVGEKVAWTGNMTAAGEGVIYKPDLFGGEQKEGGLEGRFYFLPGEETQVLPGGLAGRLGLTPTDAPGYRGTGSVWFYGELGGGNTGGNVIWDDENYTGIGGLVNNVVQDVRRGAARYAGFLWGKNQPFIRGTWITAQRAPKGCPFGAPIIGANGDANPAHIIYECLTDTDWGMGAQASIVDADDVNSSFAQVAQQLENEGFGLTMIWTRQSDIENFIQEVLDHIQATLYVDPTTGKFTLKLLRDDYNPAELPVLDMAKVKVRSFQRKAWGEVTNEITVTYTNPENEQDETVTVQNLAAIEAQGDVSADSRNFYGIRNRNLALDVAERELRLSSSPLAGAEIELEAGELNLFPGAVVRLDWPRHEADQVIMRVMGLTEGEKEGKVRVSLMEDVFALTKASIPAGQATQWESPDLAPTLLDEERVFTLPYAMTTRLGLAGTEDGLLYPEAVTGVLGFHPSGDVISVDPVVEVTTPDGNVYFNEVESRRVSGHAQLNAPIPAEARTVYNERPNVTTNRGPVENGFVMIGNGDESEVEIALIKKNPAGDGFQFVRGIYDTVPKAWPAGTDLWFFVLPSEIADTSRVRGAGEVATYKLRARTSKGTMDLDLVPTLQHTVSDRPHRPARPANVQIDGQSFGAVDLDGKTEIAITWARRNRLAEDASPLAWDDPDQVPEANQVTNIRATDNLGNEIAVWLDVPGTRKVLQVSEFAGHNTVFLEVFSSRDDLPSLSAYGVWLTQNGATPPSGPPGGLDDLFTPLPGTGSVIDALNRADGRDLVPDPYFQDASAWGLGPGPWYSVSRNGSSYPAQFGAPKAAVVSDEWWTGSTSAVIETAIFSGLSGAATTFAFSADGENNGPGSAKVYAELTWYRSDTGAQVGTPETLVWAKGESGRKALQVTPPAGADSRRFRVYTENGVAWSGDGVVTNLSMNFTHLVRDETPPEDPTSFNAVPRFTGALLTWVNPTDDDLSHIEVWSSPTNSLGAAEHILTANQPAEQITATGQATDTTFYYWIRAVDRWGYKSDFVGPQSVTTDLLTPADMHFPTGSIARDALGLNPGDLGFNLLDIPDGSISLNQLANTIQSEIARVSEIGKSVIAPGINAGAQGDMKFKKNYYAGALNGGEIDIVNVADDGGIPYFNHPTLGRIDMNSAITVCTTPWESTSLTPYGNRFYLVWSQKTRTQVGINGGVENFYTLTYNDETETWTAWGNDNSASFTPDPTDVVLAIGEQDAGASEITALRSLVGNETPVIQRVDTLENEVGSDGQAGTIKGRITGTETILTGIDGVSGLVKQTDDLELVVQGADGNSGLVGSVSNHETILQTDDGSGTGLVQRVADAFLEIGDNQTGNTIKGRIKSQEDIVGDANSGLVQQTNQLELVVQGADGTSGLVGSVSTLDQAVFSGPDALVGRTSDLELKTSRTASLVVDNLAVDASGWYTRDGGGPLYTGSDMALNAVNEPAESSALSGVGSGILNQNTSQAYFTRFAIPVDTSREYRMRIKVHFPVGVAGHFYAGVATLDGDYGAITGGAGSHRYFATGGGRNQAIYAGQTQTFEGIITGEGDGAEDFRPGTVYVRPMFIASYNATGQTAEPLVLAVEFDDVTEELTLEGRITDTDNILFTDDGATGVPTRGLIERSRLAELEIGDDQTGGTIKGRIKSQEDIVGDASGGLVKRTTDVENQLNTPTTGVLARLGQTETALTDGSDPDSLVSIAQRVSTTEALDTQILLTSPIMGEDRTQFTWTLSQPDYTTGALRQFTSSYTGKAALRVKASDAESGARVTVNGNDTFIMTGPDNAVVWYEFIVDVVSGVNDFHFWSPNGDGGSIQEVELRGTETGARTAIVEEALFDGDETRARLMFLAEANGRISSGWLTSSTNPNGQTTTQIGFDADVFGIWNGSAAVPAFEVSGGNVFLKGDLIAAGSITGSRINAATAINVGTGNALAGGLFDRAGMWGQGSNSNPIRFFAGHTAPTQAPFQVDQAGGITARRLTILTEDGGAVWFDTLTGFSELARTQILAQSSPRTDRIADTASSSNDVVAFALVENKSITGRVKVNKSGLTIYQNWDEGSAEPAEAFPSTLTLQIQTRPQGGAWTTRQTKSYSKITSGTPTSSQFLVSVTTQEPDSFDTLEDGGGPPQQQTFTIPGYKTETVTSPNELVSEFVNTFVGDADGETYEVRAVLSASGGNPALLNFATKSRAIELEAPGKDFVLDLTTVQGEGNADTLDGIDSSGYWRKSELTSPLDVGTNGQLPNRTVSSAQDSVTDSPFAIQADSYINFHSAGYLRKLIGTQAGEVQIGQTGTAIITGINLLPGSSGVAKVNGQKIATESWVNAKTWSASDITSGTLAEARLPATAVTSNDLMTSSVNWDVQADFIVRDSRDGTTNFIWRDVSAKKLYLGTSDAAVEFRGPLPLHGGSYMATRDWVNSQGFITAVGNISASDITSGTLNHERVREIDVFDSRNDATVDPLPSEIGDRRFRMDFRISGSPTSNWRSVLSTTGWDDGTYATHQLSFNATNAVNAANTDLYHRCGTGATWNPWRKIWDDGNFNPDNKVSWDTVISSDLDAIPDNATLVTNWANSTVNRPAAAQSNEYGVVLNLAYKDAGRAWQIAGDFAEDNMYFRARGNANAWRKIWHDGNVSALSTALNLGQYAVKNSNVTFNQLDVNENIDIASGTGTIAGSNFSGGWLRVGGSSQGWAMDGNELYGFGACNFGAANGGTLNMQNDFQFNGDINMSSSGTLDGNNASLQNFDFLSVGNGTSTTWARWSGYFYKLMNYQGEENTTTGALHGYMQSTVRPTNMTGDRERVGVYGRSLLNDGSTSADANVNAPIGVKGYADIGNGHADSMMAGEFAAAVNGGSDSVASNIWGLRGRGIVDNAGSLCNGSLYGTEGRAEIYADVTTNVPNVYGGNFWLNFDGGSATTARMIRGYADIETGVSVTNLWGLELNFGPVNSGTVTNAYGIVLYGPEYLNLKNTIGGRSYFSPQATGIVAPDSPWVGHFEDSSGTDILFLQGSASGAYARFTRGTSYSWETGIRSDSHFVIHNASLNETKLEIDENALPVRFTNAGMLLDGKEAIQGNDNWLRVNDSGGFPSGIYMGGSKVRTDGHFNVNEQLYLYNNRLQMPFGFEVRQHETGWNAQWAYARRLRWGYNTTWGDFCYIGSTGNGAGSVHTATIMGGVNQGIAWGTGTENGDTLTTQWMHLDANGLRVNTTSGYVDIGPQNTGFCHFQTDRSRFYFNKEIEVDGPIQVYQSGNQLDAGGLNLDSASSIDFGSHTGVRTLMSLEGRAVVRQISDRGGMTYASADDTAIYGGGDTAHNFHTLINPDAEATYLVSDNNVIIVTELQGGYSTSNQITFDQGGIICAGNVTQNSDARLKKTVEDLRRFDLSLFKARSYEWIESGKADWGAVAQEVQEFAPEAVQENDGTLSVNYAKLSVIALHELKHERARNDELEAKLDETCNRLQRLEARLEALV